VRKKHHAQREAQKQRRNRCLFGIDHGKSSSGLELLLSYAYERKLDSDWDRMDQAARKKARATLAALRRERNEVAEWYG
jgi:hypothetical protein